MVRLTKKEKAKIIQKVKENSTSIYNYIASQLYAYDKANNISTMLIYYDYTNNVCYTHVAVFDITEDLYYAIKENKVVLVYVVKGLYNLCNYNYTSIYKDSDDAADFYRHPLVAGINKLYREFDECKSSESDYNDDVFDINLKDCVYNINLNIRINVGIYKFDYGYHYDDYGATLVFRESK